MVDKADIAKRELARRVANRKWWNKYMAPMVGMKIVSIGLSKDEFPYFIVTDGKDKRFQITVSSDEEGNGPGFLFGLPRVK